MRGIPHLKSRWKMPKSQYMCKVHVISIFFRKMFYLCVPFPYPFPYLCYICNNCTSKQTGNQHVVRYNAKKPKLNVTARNLLKLSKLLAIRNHMFPLTVFKCLPDRLRIFLLFILTFLKQNPFSLIKGKRSNSLVTICVTTCVLSYWYFFFISYHIHGYIQKNVHGYILHPGWAQTITEQHIHKIKQVKTQVFFTNNQCTQFSYILHWTLIAHSQTPVGL